MDTDESIRQHIKALRDEVDRQHRQRHAAIDKLEADLLGSSVRQENETSEPDTKEVEVSNVDRVLAVLDERRYKTVKDIMCDAGLEESQVRGALYAKSTDRRIERRKVKGRKADFRLLREAPKQQGNKAQKPSAAQAILALLTKQPDGLTASEIADVVVEQIQSSAKKKRATVFSALFNLKKRQKVAFSEETDRYTKT
jgi:hypothetical protein